VRKAADLLDAAGAATAVHRSDGGTGLQDQPAKAAIAAKFTSG
jgi:hypothetical protein